MFNGKAAILVVADFTLVRMRRRPAPTKPYASWRQDGGYQAGPLRPMAAGDADCYVRDATRSERLPARSRFFGNPAKIMLSQTRGSDYLPANGMPADQRREPEDICFVAITIGAGLEASDRKAACSFVLGICVFILGIHVKTSHECFAGDCIHEIRVGNIQIREYTPHCS